MKVVAKVTDTRWGYEKGDVLDVRYTNGDFVGGKNLTCPGRFGCDYSVLAPHEYKLYKEKHTKHTVYSVSVFKIFGIPVFSKTVKVPAETGVAE